MESQAEGLDRWQSVSADFIVSTQPAPTSTVTFSVLGMVNTPAQTANGGWAYHFFNLR